MTRINVYTRLVSASDLIFISVAARMLRISRHRLYDKLKKIGIPA